MFVCRLVWRSLQIVELVLEGIGEKRTLQNNVILRKANWIRRILRVNCHLHHVIEGQMMEVKGVGRRRSQILDYFKNRRKYWGLKEEDQDRKRCKRQLFSRT